MHKLLHSAKVQLIMRATSQMWLFVVFIQPILYLVMTLFLMKDSTRSAYSMAAIIGAGMMGTWSSILFSSGSDIDRERRWGTLLTIFSTSGLGMLIGSFGLAAREINRLSNLAYFILLIFCGINYPVTRLPFIMQKISYMLPLTRGVQAVRAIMNGAGFDSVAPLLRQEFFIGIIYVLRGFIFFKLLEYISKNNGTLDAY